MAYHVYRTLGIVLEGKPQSDADKYYAIFTEKLGLVLASAKSVRKLESRLRFGLDDFTISEFSFIRGRYGWKLTSVREIQNIFRTLQDDHAKRKSAVTMLRILRQLLAGEESHEELYSMLIGALHFLESSTLSQSELKVFESIALMRILSLLGYAKEREEYASLISTTAWSSFLLSDAELLVPQMNDDITDSLQATQLTEV